MRGALSLWLLSFNVWAEPTAMEMKTETGMVTLYTNPCAHEPPKQGFDYEAQATDGAVVHKGCWGKDGGSVHIWFYDEPQQPFIASFGRYYFKPKGEK